MTESRWPRFLSAIPAIPAMTLMLGLLLTAAPATAAPPDDRVYVPLSLEVPRYFP